MTVRLETTIKRYIGLSTDEKPTPGQPFGEKDALTSADVPAGSTFLATDSNEIWHWDGREWVVGEGPEVRELKEIKGLLGAILERLPVVPLL